MCWNLQDFVFYHCCGLTQSYCGTVASPSCAVPRHLGHLTRVENLVCPVLLNHISDWLYSLSAISMFICSGCLNEPELQQYSHFFPFVLFGPFDKVCPELLTCRRWLWCAVCPLEGTRLPQSQLCGYVGHGSCSADPGADWWPLPKFECLCVWSLELCAIQLRGLSVFVQLGVKSIFT